MSTNFYCRKISKERRKYFIDKFERLHNDLIKSIDDIRLDYKTVLSVFLIANQEDEIEIHLGQLSGGWQFLWNYHNGRYFKPTLDSIKEFLSQDDMTIYNENGNIFTVQQFLNDEIGDNLYLKEGITDGSTIKYGKDYYIPDWHCRFFKNDGLCFSKSEYFR